MMSKLLNVALAAALGFGVSASLYAADTSQSSQTKQSTSLSDAEVRAAMDKCNNLTGTPQAKCITNIRRTPTGDKVANNASSPAEGGAVKDGTAQMEAEYAAAAKECEAAYDADMDRCVSTAKEHFGRM